MSDKEKVEVLFGAETGSFNKGVSDAASQVRQFIESTKKLNEETIKSPNSFRAAISELKNLDNGLGAATKKTEALGSALSGMGRNKALTLQYTASDIVASLSSGISPMTILMQQGGQVAQVFGAASLAVMGVGAAVAFAAYEWYSATEKADSIAKEMTVKLNAFNSTYLVGEVEAITSSFDRLPGVSKDAARDVATAFASMNGAGGKSLNELMELSRNFSAVMGLEFDKGGLALAKALENPAEGIKKLNDLMHGQLDPALMASAQKMIDSGEVVKAQGYLIDALNGKLNHAADDGLTNFSKRWNEFKNMLADDWSLKNVASTLTFGMSDFVEPEKPKEKTPEEQAKEAEWKKANDALIAYNRDMAEANRLSGNLKTEAQQHAETLEKIKNLRAYASEAKQHDNPVGAENYESAANAMQEKLDKVSEAKAKAAEREADQARKEGERIARASKVSADNEIQGIQRVQEARFRTTEQGIRLQLDQQQIGLEQEFAALKENRDRQNQADIEAFERRRSLWSQTSDEWKRITNEMDATNEKYKQDSIKLEQDRIREVESANRKLLQEQKKAAEEAAKPWDKAFGVIENSLDSMLEGILRGTQTTDEAFRRLAGNLVLSMINASTKSMMNWVKDRMMEATGSVQADTIKTASKLSSNATAIASDKAAASQGIMASAAEAAGKVYESVAAIPYVGWILAPAAAAGAFATVAAYNSFEVGTNLVPEDMQASIHKGERIVPKADNEKLMQAVESGTGGGGAVHLHVNAMDSKDVKRFLSKNNKAIGKQVQSYMRGGGRIAMAGG